ncbi:hypothetical protein JW979_06310, partial [bacterium]|nr:hypothetical protein [candidate division CSSED10-310 bacterium]
MKSFPIGAIILGGHFHSLGVIRCLAKKGISIVLMDYETNISRFSRYVRRYYKCPEYHREKKMLDFMMNIAERQNLQGWVVFPSDDESVYFLSTHKKYLDPYFRITSPDWETCKYTYNKKYTYTLAEELGIAVPKTYY